MEEQILKLKERSRGPHMSLARQGYTNEILLESMPDFIADDEEIVLDDFWVDYKTSEVILKPMPAFMCILAYQDPQNIYEAVNHFVLTGEYSKLLRFLKSRLRLSEYEMIAEDYFGTY